MEKLLFAFLVENFDDVKKLYNQGKYLESFELFKKKLDEINKKISPKGTIKGVKLPWG